MIFLRTISIFRPTSVTNTQGGLQVGDGGYSGLQAGGPTANETPVCANVPASIQAEALGNTKATDVPASAPGPIKWSIYLPKTALSLGTIKDDDIAVDDLGDRYMVAAAYFNALGYKLLTIKLKA